MRRHTWQVAVRINPHICCDAFTRSTASLVKVWDLEVISRCCIGAISSGNLRAFRIALTRFRRMRLRSWEQVFTSVCAVATLSPYLLSKEIFSQNDRKIQSSPSLQKPAFEICKDINKSQGPYIVRELIPTHLREPGGMIHTT